VLLLMPEGAAPQQIVERLGAADVSMLVARSGEEALPILRSGSVDCLVIDESAADFDPMRVVEALEAQPLLQLLPVVFFGQQGESLIARWKRGDGALALRERIPPSGCSTTSTSSSIAAPDRSPRTSGRAWRSCTARTACWRKTRAAGRRRHAQHLSRSPRCSTSRAWRSSRPTTAATRSRIVENDANLDVVLMDIMMPEMDGITTIREIKKLPRGRELPIIAVTAKAMKGDRGSASRPAPGTILSKPVDRQHLLPS